MNITRLQKLLLVAVLSSGMMAKAETIASQDFNSTNFPTVLQLDNGTIGSTVNHIGSGAAGTDLGFMANGRKSASSSASPVFEVSNGFVTFSDYSRASDACNHWTTELLSGASTLNIGWGDNLSDYTALFYTPVVNLSRHDSCTFSMDVGDLAAASNDNSEEIVVRLWVNGNTEVTLLDTTTGSNSSVTYDTISHSFADTDTSAQLLVDIRNKDLNDGYRIDNILFQGTPDPNLPTFGADPVIAADGRATVAYSDNIAGSATNPDGAPISYTKLSGPTWLTISPNGDLSGTPGLNDIGVNSFSIQASDGNGGLDEATLEIQINDPEGNPPYDPAPSATDQIRLIWLDDPSSTMTIAWKQTSGAPATVHYGKVDHGRFEHLYLNTFNTQSTGVSRTYNSSITSQFASLTNLAPDTAYYFVLKDDSGVSERYWFKTAPATPEPFSFIAGGDSRNNRSVRKRANKLVGKLRPLFVAFTGDMIDNDNPTEWNDWLNDWELTTSSDGRMYPILPHRGNHEGRGNSTLVNLFNAPTGNYYALNFGGNLLRYYVLNSEDGESTQATWLQNDLNNAGGKDAFTHLMAGYHKPMRPHQIGKPENTFLYDACAQLFYDNGFDLIFESDSHVMKRTQPIRPSIDSGHDEGFVVDTVNGTVYVGEGCWGAPLRDNNDDKSWTIKSDKFNGFDLVHVFTDYIEVFTCQVDNEGLAVALTEDDTMTIPAQLELWQAAGEPRLVVNRGAAAKESYAQYQLDSFGSNMLPENSGKQDDFDGDKISNFMEFAFGLDAATTTTTSFPNFPSFAIEPGSKKLVHQRRSNTTVKFSYYLSEDLGTWSLLEEDVDYTINVSPGPVRDVVEINLIGDAAARNAAFLRVGVAE